MARLPGLVSDIKWGAWCGSRRAVLGAPPEAERMEYLLHFAEALQVPMTRTIEETVRAALDRIGPSAGAGAAHWLLTVTVAPARGSARVVSRLLAAQGQGILI